MISTGHETLYVTANFTNQFVDTNVLVCAHDRTAGVKYKQARNLLLDLWKSGRGCLSIQVFQEFYVALTRKVANPLGSQDVAQIINNLSAWQIHSPTVDDIQEAIVVQTTYNISFRDAMIVRSAVQLGCRTLWSEDLNAGQKYRTMVVANPFD